MKYQSEIINEILEKRGHEMSSLHYESECIETWIEETKGGYPKLCDYESEWLNYINENPIGEFPYETITNVTEATVNNVVPYAYKSAILKGQTLVNVVDKIWFSSSVKYFFISLKQYEVNKNYLLVMFNVPNEITQIYFGNSSGTITWKNYTTDFIRNGSTVSLKVTCPSNYDGSTVLSQFKFESSEPSLDEVKQMKAMLIPYQEGMENWDIPYFEGMQSVKMPVLTTTGKNLFDGELELGAISNGINKNWGEYFRSKNFIPIKPNTAYGLPNQILIDNTLYDGKYELNFYDNDKKYIGKVVDKICITPPNAKFMKICYFVKQNFTVTLDMLNGTQIYLYENGTTNDEFEPYKTNILTVNEDVTLRGVGDVTDTLDCLTGEVVERIGEIVLDGSDDEGWKKVTVEPWTNDTYTTFDIAVQPTGIPCWTIHGIHVICDKYKSTTYDEAGKNGIGCLMYDARGKKLAIRQTTIKTIEDWKLSLSSNPITVQYQLATESVKTVELTITNQDGETLTKLTPFEGTMHISTNGTPIKPTVSMEIPVEAITQNLASFIEEE